MTAIDFIIFHNSQKRPKPPRRAGSEKNELSRLLRQNPCLIKKYNVVRKTSWPGCRSWVTRTIGFPFSFKSTITFSIALVEIGSRLAVGSSSSRISGSPTSMRASARRCFSPPKEAAPTYRQSACKIKLFQYHIRLLAGVCTRHAGQVENKFKIGFCRTAQQNRILFHVTKMPIIITRWSGLPAHGTMPCIRLHQSGQHFQKKRFARTIVAQEWLLLPACRVQSPQYRAACGRRG